MKKKFIWLLIVCLILNWYIKSALNKKTQNKTNIEKIKN